MSEVTRMLSEIERGDVRAAEQLLPLVYEELRKLAAHRLAHEKPGQTLQATALVHEAYMRLVECGAETAQWNGRGHFFAAAAEAMRRILVENARRKQSHKRGGQWQQVELEVPELTTRLSVEQLLDLDDALSDLARLDPAKARLVTLRYFGGLTLEQAAEVLAVSRVTASRHWTFARAWLFQRLKSGDTTGI